MSLHAQRRVMRLGGGFSGGANVEVTQVVLEQVFYFLPVRILDLRIINDGQLFDLALQLIQVPTHWFVQGK
jgi:hypothetical protein